MVGEKEGGPVVEDEGRKKSEGEKASRRMVEREGRRGSGGGRRQKEELADGVQ